MNLDSTPASSSGTGQSQQPPGGDPAPTRAINTGASAFTSKLNSGEVKARRLDALIKAIDWSHVVGWQVARLHQAEQAALRLDLDRRGEGEYRQEHREPFSRLRAETSFLLGAARQLVRAMERFGDKKKVPSFKHGSEVLIVVRDAAEHWDGRAPQKLAEHTSAPWDDYTFGGEGTVIAGLLKVDELDAWAREVQAHLLQVERSWGYDDVIRHEVRCRWHQTELPPARGAQGRAGGSRIPDEETSATG